MKKIKRSAFLNGVFVILLIGLIASIIFPSYKKAKEGACLVQQRFIWKILKEHINSGNKIPSNLSKLASLKYRGTKYEFKYSPNSWGKAGEVLLQHSVFGTHIVTFGDGSSAILYRYYNTEQETIVPAR
ncbi:MAG: hypothetical protein FVQ80_07520 [Planctomycetes bacterium]|nr:hypothetical protein [Planctomycetota bacterium]